MERELSLEIVRVTEAAAIASAPWMGRGDKNAADGAATSAMRKMFDTVSVAGTVVIGEGEMDEAPMLYIGEKVGGGGPEVDIAVDPVEGTILVANGLNNALAVIAIAPRGHLLHAPDMYMNKLACGPELAGVLDIMDPPEVTARKAAEKLGKKFSDMTVVLLDRERHNYIIDALRGLGVRIKMLSDGDVVGAIAPCFPETGVDLYMGAGGAPEGVIAAAALKCMGGELQGRLLPSNDEEYARCISMGLADPHKVLTMDDMVGSGDVIFAGTGITPGEFLGGVRYLPGERVVTDSIVMRARTQTVRRVQATHYLPNKKFLFE
jgi:fructose-1,6-bisphosphatase II